MRRIFVILGILLIGFIYARVDKSDEQVLALLPEDSSIHSIPDEQQSIIRDYLFVNSECEFSSPISSSSLSRIPTRTLQQNVFQRFLLSITQQNIETKYKIYVSTSDRPKIKNMIQERNFQSIGALKKETCTGCMLYILVTDNGDCCALQCHDLTMDAFEPTSDVVVLTETAAKPVFDFVRS